MAFYLIRLRHEVHWKWKFLVKKYFHMKKVYFCALANHIATNEQRFWRFLAKCTFIFEKHIFVFQLIRLRHDVQKHKYFRWKSSLIWKKHSLMLHPTKLLHDEQGKWRLLVKLYFHMRKAYFAVLVNKIAPWCAGNINISGKNYCHISVSGSGEEKHILVF